MTLRCPACGFENPPGMRFCGQCATALVRSPSLGEERKLVTVLFADVVGSTHLAIAVDPEQVRERMASFFQIASEEVHRNGGRVEKFIGDAVMAVFGLPAIHEDDPARAARAAASLSARVRSEVERGALPNIRIGINTGEVVANARAAYKGEFLVTGEAVNIAARLQQHADPGQILVGERTMRALQGIAELRAVPPLAVKDTAVPLPAWALFEVAPSREREVRSTPFVGRAEELDLLRECIRRMRREDRGCMVTILGQAGVGKTRLVQEFRARTEGVQILRGRALPYGTGVPFWALGEAIKEECAILMGDPLEVARAKLHEAAVRLDVADAVPALLTVLGLAADDRSLTRDELFHGMRAFFQAIAHQAPLLLILEDLHSAEDVTLDYIERTADWLRDVPVVLLVLSRPELLDRRPTWMEGKRGVTTLFLDPLPGAESRELIRGLLGGKPVPTSLFEFVLDRAEGNPLFMEEMLLTLVERRILTDDNGGWILTTPLSKVSIPDTVHAVIAARVDALPGDEKEILETAAVIGKDCSLGALRFIAGAPGVDAALWALVKKGVMVHKQRSTLEDEEDFTFRHILIRDVAYSMLPKSQRWPKHARCAEWLHRIGGNRQAEYADVIAHHWLQVMALRQDLGLAPDPQAREQAIANLLLAGDRAAGLYANTTALDNFTRALELEPSRVTHRDALLGRGKVWMLLGQHERARDDFAAVRTLAQNSGEARWEAIALDHLGHSYRRQDQIAHALEHLKPALTLSREVGDPALTGRILNHIGFSYFNLSKHAQAFAMHEEARRLLEECGDIAGLSESLHGLGETSSFLGRFEEAIEWFRKSVEASEQVGNRSLAGENRYMIAWLRKKQGAYADAQAEAQRAVAELTKIGDVWNASFALSRLAEVSTVLGRFGDALSYTSQSLRLAQQIEAGRQAVSSLLEIGTTHRELEDYHGAWEADRQAIERAHAGEVAAYWMPIVLASLALDSVGLGRSGEARSYIAQARRALLEGTNRADFPQEVAHAEGRVMLAQGYAKQAHGAAKALVELAIATGTLHWRVSGLLLLAESTAALGDPGAAVPVYQAAAEEAERLDRAPALWRALAGMAASQRAMGRAPEATASARRAREIVESLAATVPDERLRAMFLQSAMVQGAAPLAGA
jgi:class 3 adenylate cyclase/tetratricopeptide (TPR) repeat protein